MIFDLKRTHSPLIILSLLVMSTIPSCGGSGGSGGNSVDNDCMSTAVYPAQNTSKYILPWTVGETYTVGQGNCTGFSHGIGNNQQFAYDFYMPIGTEIRAARSGKVAAIRENFKDGTEILGQENYIFVEHEDGSIGRYAHITILGALFDEGDIVEQGDVIALSGNTGASTAPHLHFDVHDGNCPILSIDCNPLEVTFKNTDPHPNGLIEGVSYTAEPFFATAL
jgi:murein DD-endopeptidase MepM/ murein hydrolase activator NlpD